MFFFTQSRSRCACLLLAPVKTNPSPATALLSVPFREQHLPKDLLLVGPIYNRSYENTLSVSREHCYGTTNCCRWIILEDKQVMTKPTPIPNSIENNLSSHPCPNGTVSEQATSPPFKKRRKKNVLCTHSIDSKSVNLWDRSHL